MAHPQSQANINCPQDLASACLAGTFRKSRLLFSQITTWDNLLLAFRKAARGKRGLPNVAQFERRLEDNLLQLQAELTTGVYRPGNYHSFYIHDPKRRLISAAPFRDRVVHHALCNIIEPNFESSFIADSYANRIGKGTHRALDRCQTFARRYPYVLQLDIQKFFPAIDHAILLKTLTKKISDPQTLHLCNQIIASGTSVIHEDYEIQWFPDDDLFAALRPRGLPIGNLTSQFWANVYLNPFDHFVKRQLRCKAYIRYVDDIVLFYHTKPCLWEWKSACEQYLATLRLQTHPNAQVNPTIEGVSFLGWHIFPQKRRLKSRNVTNFRRRFKASKSAYQKKKITLTDLTVSVQGWTNHARYGNTVALRKVILREPITSND